MKFVERLRKIISEKYEIVIFITIAALLHAAILNGKVYQKPRVDSKIQEIVKYFNETAAMYRVYPDTKNLVVSFVNKFPVNTWVGLCQQNSGNPSKYISIHRGYFKNASLEQQYALVIHELGHCTLNRKHVEGYLANGCPKSIMHPSDGLFGCFFKNQDYYFKELFQK